MSRRVVVIGWVVLAALLWNVVFDLHVSRGAREYLQLAAEADLGRGPVPSMPDVMREARWRGVAVATQWALTVLGAGLATLFLKTK